jgi:hypothetical protein
VRRDYDLGLSAVDQRVEGTCIVFDRANIHEHMQLQPIANKLNTMGVTGLHGRKWTRNMVTGVLRNPKYKGTLRYNATTQKLRSKIRKNPETEWIVVPGAYESVVEPAIFDMAQQEFRNLPYNWSNDQVVEALRSSSRSSAINT